jgi:hypothetical protein
MEEEKICKHLYDGPDRNGHICPDCGKIINNQAAEPFEIRYTYEAEWLPKSRPHIVIYDKD